MATYTLRVRVEYEASIEIDADSRAAAKVAFESGDYDGNSLELAEMVNWDVRSIKETPSDV